MNLEHDFAYSIFFMNRNHQTRGEYYKLMKITKDMKFYIYACDRRFEFKENPYDAYKLCREDARDAWRTFIYRGFEVC